MKATTAGTVGSPEKGGSWPPGQLTTSVAGGPNCSVKARDIGLVMRKSRAPIHTSARLIAIGRASLIVCMRPLWVSGR